jgi:hypothetical protein
MLGATLKKLMLQSFDQRLTLHTDSEGLQTTASHGG